MREELSEAVQLAVSISRPAPSNEDETRFRIVDPLLRAMGYGLLDIKLQDRDRTKGKPDYSILPGTDHAWFIEAKSWGVTLNDDHAIQAVNYANTQGKRWCVLSNGREWRLYDNHILGTVDKKLAYVARLDDPSFVGFLEALSKPSVQGLRLEGFVRNERLYSYLADQIASEDSDVIRAVAKVLRSVPGLSEVSSGAIVGFLSDSAPVRRKAEAGTRAEPSTKPEELAPKPAQEPSQLALGSLTASDITGAKVKALVLPSGEVKPIGRWKDLTAQAALFALGERSMPSLPFFAGAKSKSPLVARFGSPESEKMREPMRLSAPHEEVLVEGHFSAIGHQEAAVRLLRASGIDPGTFRIVL